MITQLRRLPGTPGERTVASTGRVDAHPNSINVIPEEVTITWDIRDPDDDTVTAGRDRVLASAALSLADITDGGEEVTDATA